MESDKTMSKSGIEYVDNGWTPQDGCLFFKTETCQVDCWAEKLRRRNPKAYPKGFYPAFHLNRLEEPLKLTGSRTIFTCHTGDAWGSWVKDEHLKMIFDIILQCPQHRFLMLTKNPQRMRRFFNYLNRTVPDNVWLGASVTTNAELNRISDLPFKEKGGKRWLSIEPLLEKVAINRTTFEVKVKQAGIDWIVIGMQTNPNIEPNPEVYIDLFMDVMRLKIPVFVKNNMKDYLKREGIHDLFCQQLPWEMK